MTTIKVKKLSDRFNTFEELAKFVRNGRIVFEKSGRVSFFKEDYILQKDTIMNQTDYGYKFETDSRLSRDGVPRTKTFPKGTKTKLNYDPYNNYYVYGVVKSDGKNGSYRSNHHETWKQEEVNAEWELCKKLFPKNHLEYNCIGNFYAWVKNGVVKLSN